MPKTTAAKPETEPKPEEDQQSAALDAAITEATDPDAPIKVEFRGQPFLIKRETLSSARFRLALARREAAGIIAEMLDPQDLDRLMVLIPRGEQMDALGEFLGVMSDAAGWGKLGNS